MEVFKFGGASIYNAQYIKQLAQIVKEANRPLVIVISAMGKTTNTLEKIVNAYFFHNKDFKPIIEEIKNYHYSITKKLFQKQHIVFDKLKTLFSELEQTLQVAPSMNYDFDYDRIVHYGELLSTTIISEYLNNIKIKNTLINAQNLIHTDSNYRQAKINWQKTHKAINQILNFQKTDIFITQGFIGSDANKQATTLGREGSDFTAAIIAWALNAKKITVWKDVQGIYSADPKFYPNAKLFKRLSYDETIELAYYGAKVIHPKTLKPLKDKSIPLYVKSFLTPHSQGTIITEFDKHLDPYMPIIINKTGQTLISIRHKDSSFITERDIEKIFCAINHHKIVNNVMQRSALNFSFCVDYHRVHLPNLIEELKRNFQVKYNTDLQLITIRHYDRETIKKMTADKEILLHQQSRTNVFFVVRNK